MQNARKGSYHSFNMQLKIFEVALETLHPKDMNQTKIAEVKVRNALPAYLADTLTVS